MWVRANQEEQSCPAVEVTKRTRLAEPGDQDGPGLHDTHQARPQSHSSRQVVLILIGNNKDWTAPYMSVTVGSLSMVVVESAGVTWLWQLPCVTHMSQVHLGSWVYVCHTMRPHIMHAAYVYVCVPMPMLSSWASAGVA